MLIPVVENLLLAGSKSLAVDGSSVNKVFSYSPSSGSIQVTALCVILDDPGTSSLNKFGSINALTNGLLLSVTINSSTTNITTIKDNADLATRFINSHFGSSASDTLGGAVGFGDTYDAFSGVLKLQTPLVLTGSDSIQITVRDNLSGISSLQISVIIEKEI